ncbi:hypothetical protein [Desulfolithobacter sp.]
MDCTDTKTLITGSVKRPRAAAIVVILFILGIIAPSGLQAGPYMNSAHGSAMSGVYRPTIGDQPPSGAGYSRGNCAHCHEQHASVNGAEPFPTNGPAAYEIFAPNFNTAAQTGPYIESDNFCFSCHNSTASIQVVQNRDYSETFGCDNVGSGPTSIMDAMNQQSYHNLYDIWTFSRNQFNWFSNDSNPCGACHNPHLARRNMANTKDPAFSAISKPADHFSLWTQTMDNAFNTSYEPPFCNDTATTREPDGSGDAISGRAATPDYVGFCTDCHNTTTTITSTLLGTVIQIDWGPGGDKHGTAGDSPGDTIKAPYSGTSTYVLSCADCHEPHGAPNIRLLRRRVNGKDLTDATGTAASITSSNSNQWGYLCRNCHMDDYDATQAQLPGYQYSTGARNKWEYIHHLASDRPYVQKQCGWCHPGGGMNPPPIPCNQCHVHGQTF